jgi:hypothetical protein
MYKIFVLFWIVSLFRCLQAFAGSLEFNCINNESTLILTEQAIVIELPGLPSREYTNTFSEAPTRNARIEFSSRPPRAQQVGYFEVDSVLAKNILSEQQMPDCENGVGARLAIETFLVNGRLHVNALEPQNVQLNCTQRTFWSGNCD